MSPSCGAAGPRAGGKQTSGCGDSTRPFQQLSVIPPTDHGDSMCGFAIVCWSYGGHVATMTTTHVSVDENGDPDDHSRGAERRLPGYTQPPWSGKLSTQLSAVQPARHHFSNDLLDP